jgi:hypothetical protein
MRQVWAVARLTIREAMRMKIALIFIILLFVLLPVFSYAIHGDGVTLASRIRMFLSFSVSAVSGLLCVLTIFLACGALSNEVRDKSVQMSAVKPIARWRYVLGKWVGIMTLNLVLLVVAGGMVYGLARWLQNKPTISEADAYAVNHEVFTARAGMPLRPPDFTAEIDQRIRQLRKEGTLSVTPTGDLEPIRKDLEQKFQHDYLTIPPKGGYRIFEFQLAGHLIDRTPGHYLTIRCKPSALGVPRDYIWRTTWILGDLNKETAIAQLQRHDPDERFSDVMVPTPCVADDGTLRVVIVNLDPSAYMTFSDYKANMEVLFRLGGFGSNLFRGFVLVYWRLMFLAAVGLLASSFLSFPVACLATFAVFVVSIGAGFLHESLSWVEPGGGSDPFSFLGPVIRGLLYGSLWLVPDLSAYNPVPYLVDGRVVSLYRLAVGLLELVLIRTLLLGFFACVIYSRRELAKVMV